MLKKTIDGDMYKLQFCLSPCTDGEATTLDFEFARQNMYKKVKASDPMSYSANNIFMYIYVIFTSIAAC